MTTEFKPCPILVVDDDAMSRELLVVLLEHEGYTVQSAASGDAALAVIARSPGAFRIVLTDMQMPGTTGRELAARLREACGPNTILLAMSGSGASEQDIAPFDGFLLKPFKVSGIAPFLREREALEAASLLAAAEMASNSEVDKTVPSANAAPATQVAGMAQVQALDEKIYAQLASAMPTPQLHQMYDMCLGDARERIASMRVSAAAGDGVQFSRQAHAIKGGCGMLGASELYTMAGELEKLGLSKFAQGVNPLDELDTACDRLERILGSRALANS